VTKFQKIIISVVTTAIAIYALSYGIGQYVKFMQYRDKQKQTGKELQSCLQNAESTFNKYHNKPSSDNYAEQLLYKTFGTEESLKQAKEECYKQASY
jgi:hypothetical protein